MPEGFVDWDAGRTWYRVEGDLGAPATPVIVLHGGPGAAHDYLEPLAQLAALGDRACVLYDPLGCGLSEHLPDAPSDFWSVELFRRELDVLLEHLQVADRYSLLGQSWGGMLAMEHAVRKPAGLRALVIANSPASMDLWVQETGRLRSLLPADVQAALDHHEAAGSTDSEEYRAAVTCFYERHLCRRAPFPQPLQRSFDQMDADPTVYHTMNGPSEFHVVGHLRTWDITDQLPQIQVPTLLISGEHDEATPAVVQPVLEAIPDARWELFDGASHSTHLEEPERFLTTVAGFLAEHD
jgi:L-proline amide hydrolase